MRVQAPIMWRAVAGWANHVLHEHRRNADAVKAASSSQRGIDGIDGMRLIRDDIAAHVNNLAARLTDHPDRPHHKTQPYK